MKRFRDLSLTVKLNIALITLLAAIFAFSFIWMRREVRNLLTGEISRTAQMSVELAARKICAGCLSVPIGSSKCRCRRSAASASLIPLTIRWRPAAISCCISTRDRPGNCGLSAWAVRAINMINSTGLCCRSCWAAPSGPSPISTPTPVCT